MTTITLPNKTITLATPNDFPLPDELMPDCITLDVDSRWLQKIKDPSSYKSLDLIKVIKSGDLLPLLVELLLFTNNAPAPASPSNTPQPAFSPILEYASKKAIPVIATAAPLSTTIKSVWHSLTSAQKNLLLQNITNLPADFSPKCTSFFMEENLLDTVSSLLGNANEKETTDSPAPSTPQKNCDMQNIMQTCSLTTATTLFALAQKKIVAIVPASKIASVAKYLELLHNGTLDQTAALATQTHKSPLSKVVGIAIPIIIVALVALGFYRGGVEKGVNLAMNWLLWNGGLSALGALIALAHPITIIVAGVAAPFTSLCPLIGAGIVAGVVQALLCKITVGDVESLKQDYTSIRGFYRNRLLKLLLVVLFSSIGSSIGTFLGGAAVIKAI